ncbi:Amidophosphoribosyltransferase [bioreactor metagenome]|jgi:amidophosphoribosyltransferase|uniref:Amidophosphoribosyltransferase n=1 Tax=bioreactor metagenome TaxID=1076179 RepID=A0A644UZN2_9ZZZZ|nr:amidophosphoribosyltransferase [Bacteroidales bacterium]MBP6453691.1 amidophosphoribosyltransferase [Bacteroidales bacterium]MBP8678161.1 amidophosphoribosyltransferase [Bacteroidales bacterium]MBP9584586.1 amidophosphoribosyltransferase [Bacteroidales bacterium]MBP9978126.1 amidophosphoribosyltransferase [Bacteroidales bacterium]
MSDIINHECGIALIRLRKPLEYYKERYGSALYGLKRLYILMEKQRNRGQEGAGIVGVKLDMNPGLKYMDRVRSCGLNPIQEVFNTINNQVDSSLLTGLTITEAKERFPFVSELYLGHLRYSTFGKNNIDLVHPLKRSSNWRSRNLALAANFNLTNVDELFQSLIEVGQHPRNYSDTVTILEKVGYYMDDEIHDKYRYYRDLGFSREEISVQIENNIDWQSILSKSSSNWDGGYSVAGVAGHGDAFVMRDPWGIRPAFYYQDDEIVVVASEASVIRTAFNVDDLGIKEIEPGHALIVKKSGEISDLKVREPFEKRSCSFERIYFSRGNDREIYKERKKLGELLAHQIVESVNGDTENTVLTYIPNTAETSFLGMVEGMESLLNQGVIDKKPRVEKIVIKDAKLRTFITSDSDRDEMAAHVYDVTYGVVNPEENLVVIDDSIVRGTTLKNSILRILDGLNPKRIIIVSSAPQIRYPDCYGIDMTRMGEFIAFNAAIELLRECNREELIQAVYEKCKKQQFNIKEDIQNFVKEIYEPFSDNDISHKIAQMIRNSSVKAEVKIVFQTLNNLHKATPNHVGDWYFSGDYPTPGGNKVVNTAFINWFEGRDIRSY